MAANQETEAQLTLYDELIAYGWNNHLTVAEMNTLQRFRREKLSELGIDMSELSPRDAFLALAAHLPLVENDWNEWHKHRDSEAVIRGRTETSAQVSIQPIYKTVTQKRQP